MKKTLRAAALMLCLAAALFALSSCDEKSVKPSDQSHSTLVGTWIAQDRKNSEITFNTDGTGFMQRGDVTEKITFADQGNGTYEMSAEHAKTPITEGYRIEEDTLYIFSLKLGIEDAYTRKP